MVANIDQPPYNNPSSTIMLSGYSTMVWVGVTTTNMDRMLSLLDSSIVQTSSRIHPGVWSKKVRCTLQNNINLATQNKIIFQVEDQAAVDLIHKHPHAADHPHSFTVIQVYGTGR